MILKINTITITAMRKGNITNRNYNDYLDLD